MNKGDRVEIVVNRRFSGPAELLGKRGVIDSFGPTVIVILDGEDKPRYFFKDYVRVIDVVERLGEVSK